MAVLEALAQEHRQARCHYPARGAARLNVPMGVFNVRENVRSAMRERPTEFEDLKSALNHISERFTLPVQRFITETTLLRDSLRQRQCTRVILPCLTIRGGKRPVPVQRPDPPGGFGMGMRARKGRIGEPPMGSQSSRIILHADMDCFYAAVEMHDHPDIAKKPVVVGADPQGRDRAGRCLHLLVRGQGVRREIRQCQSRRRTALP